MGKSAMENRGSIEIVTRPTRGAGNRYAAIVEALRDIKDGQAVRFAVAEYPMLAKSAWSTVGYYFPGQKVRMRKDGSEHRVVWLEPRPEQDGTGRKET